MNMVIVPHVGLQQRCHAPRCKVKVKVSLPALPMGTQQVGSTMHSSPEGPLWRLAMAVQQAHSLIWARSMVKQIGVFHCYRTPGEQ